jgi:hypothetical protein
MHRKNNEYTGSVEDHQESGSKAAPSVMLVQAPTRTLTAAVCDSKSPWLNSAIMPWPTHTKLVLTSRIVAMNDASVLALVFLQMILDSRKYASCESTKSSAESA